MSPSLKLSYEKRRLLYFEGVVNKMSIELSVDSDKMIELFKNTYTEAWECVTTRRDVHSSPFHGLFRAICLLGQKENFKEYCAKRIAINDRSKDPHYVLLACNMRIFLSQHADFWPTCSTKKEN